MRPEEYRKTLSPEHQTELDAAVNVLVNQYKTFGDQYLEFSTLYFRVVCVDGVIDITAPPSREGVVTCLVDAKKPPIYYMKSV